MKTLVLALVFSFTAFSLPAQAAHDHGMQETASAPAAANAAWSEGTVKKIDKASARVTITHGPLVNLNMPAMTMVFRVKEANWLGSLKEGERIRFVAESVSGALTVVRLEPAR